MLELRGARLVRVHTIAQAALGIMEVVRPAAETLTTSGKPDKPLDELAKGHKAHTRERTRAALVRALNGRWRHAPRLLQSGDPIGACSVWRRIRAAADRAGRRQTGTARYAARPRTGLPELSACLAQFVRRLLWLESGHSRAVLIFDDLYTGDRARDTRASRKKSCTLPSRLRYPVASRGRG